MLKLYLSTHMLLRAAILPGPAWNWLGDHREDVVSQLIFATDQLNNDQILNSVFTGSRLSKQGGRYHMQTGSQAHPRAWCQYGTGARNWDSHSCSSCYRALTKTSQQPEDRSHNCFSHLYTRYKLRQP